MKIQLVSFHLKEQMDRVAEVAEIINQSTADVILFAGWTLDSHREVYQLQSRITNRDCVAVIEVAEGLQSQHVEQKHELFLLSNGRLSPMNSHQWFAEASEIEDNPLMASALLADMETRRAFKVGRRKFNVLQCGELNIVKNLQGEGNRPVFRLPQEPELEARFNSLLNDTQVILNPIHTPMGNQGKNHQKRQLLSANGRYYFSVANIKEGAFSSKAVHYAYHDGEELPRIEGIETGNTCSWIYNI